MQHTWHPHGWQVATAPLSSAHGHGSASAQWKGQRSKIVNVSRKGSNSPSNGNVQRQKRERESSTLKGDGLNLLYNTLCSDQGRLLAQSTSGEARASGLTLTNMKFLVSSLSDKAYVIRWVFYWMAANLLNLQVLYIQFVGRISYRCVFIT
jgi:hypothetical protein